MDEMIIGSAFNYYKKILTTILTIVEEEPQLKNFTSLLDIQTQNRIKLGSDKMPNEKASVEMVNVIFLVVQEKIHELFKNCHFISFKESTKQWTKRV